MCETRLSVRLWHWGQREAGRGRLRVHHWVDNGPSHMMDDWNEILGRQQS